MLYFKVFNASEEVADAVNYPQVRLFTAALRWSNKTEYDLLQVEQTWSLPDKGVMFISYYRHAHY